MGGGGGLIVDPVGERVPAPKAPGRVEHAHPDARTERRLAGEGRMTPANAGTRELQRLRHELEALDARLIALIAERARCVRDATRFKRDAYQVAAPARQAQVFARARAIAVRHEQAFPGLPDVVEATWRTMVASFVACEGKMFDDTEALPHDTPSPDPTR